MRQTLISWFLRRLERDFPVRKPRSIGLSERVKLMLQVVASCAVGVLLVAFGIAALSGKPEDFLFFAAVLLAGLAATAVLTFLMLLAANTVARWSKGLKSGLFKVEANRSLVLDCTPEAAAGRCRRALEELPQGCDLRPEEAAPGEILGKTRMSERSAGESVSIALAALADGGTRVEVVSRPWIDATLFDWGINAENVEAIARHLLGTSDPDSKEKAAP